MCSEFCDFLRKEEGDKRLGMLSFMFSVVGAALVPGLRKQGILQKLASKVTEVVRGLRRGPEKAAKTKTN